MLDCEPDWDRLVAAHERVTRAIPRLRDRVVEPIVPLVPPAFSRDEKFDVGNHLHRIRLGSGTMRELLDLASSVYDRPFQPGRPPWEGLLVEGLEGGRAAYVLKMHHSLTDGQGLVQLLTMAHSRTREPTPRDPEPPLPPSEQLNSVTLLTSRLLRQATSAPAMFLNRAGESVRLAGRTITRPTAVIG
ncbi:MAG TPA: wax ester/triacylglycerol synthase domain-containing protein, partial [Acidimicrobiia bacterium]|nr:wax ester/triacylglycerol synthase domain-containing protein [Acidimicrobiia bacterium]